MKRKPTLEVCLSPLLLHLFEPKGKVVVIIDILRASSTICTILENGASRVIPVASLEECLKYKDKENHIVAAERHGQKPDGFEFGNSPFDFPREKVEGKTVVLTTTNGTKALHMSAEASHIVIGSFLNLDSLCSWLKETNRDTVLFSAGWKNHLNFEDSVYGGAVLEMLKNDFESDLDSSLAVRYLYKNLKNRMDVAMKFSSHYKRLEGFGVSKDVDYCLSINELSVLPILQGKDLVDAYQTQDHDNKGTSF
ncbi:MAG: 2-phosphosulfolactate phosphatase [Chitinophagales bacterium]|nr:2-phosphosulfolactate phosphatase [Chitinophagales bacterium]